MYRCTLDFKYFDVFRCLIHTHTRTDAIEMRGGELNNGKKAVKISNHEKTNFQTLNHPANTAHTQFSTTLPLWHEKAVLFLVLRAQILQSRCFLVIFLSGSVIHS